MYSIRPEYVESFPKVLEEGVIYVSRRFRTACHSCCCGCGTKIVTPIRPTEYSLSERGGLVTLHPSVGNWNYPCQSHYVIRDNQILWAGNMTRAQIKKGRALVVKTLGLDQELVPVAVAAIHPVWVHSSRWKLRPW
jgi:Family of unknown function (DUF6527)